MNASSYLKVMEIYKFVDISLFYIGSLLKYIIMAKVQTTEQITRPYKYRRHHDDEKPPEPEYSIPTEDAHTLHLRNTAYVEPADPKLRLETLRQWINQTKPVKEPFEHRSNLSTWADSDHDDRFSDFSAIAVSDDTQDQWDKREFDRLYGAITRKFEFTQDIDKAECRKIHEKVKRYKKAFLKGFFEARIRRIESNKWLYDKLHVNPETIKEKYRRLMYTSDPLYVTVRDHQDSNHQYQSHETPAQDSTQPDKPSQDKEIKDTGTEHDDDLDSVYSFVPERDNVLLQDTNAPPHVRGYGKDKHRKYEDKIKLLYLDSWMPPDIQDWLNEKKARQEDDQDAEKSDPNEKFKNVYVENMQAGPKPQRKVVEDWKYEQIAGISELPTWLGPKHLDPKPELDLENFRKQDELDGGDEVDSIEAERKIEQPDKEHQEEDNKSQVSKAESELNVQQRLLRQLIQSQSKEYYKLWYNTHDTFNTTPFLEARLQRLLREVLNKREWAVYCSYLKKKHEEDESKKNHVK